MNHLPIIVFSAGYFDSRRRFPGVRVTKKRQVKEYEIELFSENGGESYINGTRHPIHRGNLLIARPGDYRNSGLHFQTHFIHFIADEEEVISLLSEMPNYITSDFYEELFPLFKQIHQIFVNKEKYFDLQCNELILRILFIIQGKNLTPLMNLQKEEESEDILSTARSIILHDFTKDISIKEIADRCHVSTTHLHRIFKTAGLTPGSFIQNLRIQKSKDLLYNTGLSIEEISEQCGFHSCAYFCTCFKKNDGITPLEFRHQR